MRTRYFLPLFLLAAAGSTTQAAEQDGGAKPVTPDGSEPRSYIGDGLRLGVGYDSKTKLRGEYYQVYQEDSAKALIGEAWVSGTAAGLKFNYHWVPDTGPTKNSVGKAFIALDQNDMRDRKLTLGGGAEYENWFWGATLSKSVSGRRQISDQTNTSVETVSGVDPSSGPYFQEVTTATNIRIFERPYDYGLGLSAGRFYEPALLRVYARADHEWGKNGAHQNTVGVGVEKFFADSPISVALNAEAYRKNGDLEPKKSDQRINLMLRYEIGGKGYRPVRESRMVPVAPATPGTDPVAPTGSSGAGSSNSSNTTALNTSNVMQESPRKTEMRMVKTTASMSADAFFKFDSVKMTDTARLALDQVIDRLKASGNVGNILLTGHTCNLGPAAYNLKLSEHRAAAIRDYLSSKGVAADQVIVEGKGEDNPRYSNKTKESRAKNRRVDMEFVSYVEKAEEFTLPVDANAAGSKGTTGTPLATTNANSKPASAAAAAAQAAVEWKREYIDVEPAWLRRALHNPVRHKQTVDVYRQEERTVTVTNGTRRYTNRPPVAGNDTFQIVVGSSNNLLDVLKNDSDPDGDAIRVLSVQNPLHGSAAVSANKIAYTPSAGYVGTDTFVYTISDDKGLIATATVTVTISAANRPPVAADDGFQVAGGSTNNQFDVLKNDTDPDGDALRILSVQSPAHGTASVSGDRVTYAPSAGYVGTDRFTYTITDDKGGNSTATITVTVGPANRPPLAVNDAFVVAGSSANNLLDVLKNDSDPDGDALSITAVQAPAHGTASVNAGKVSYAPTPGYAGTDSFTYTIADGKGGSATAVVTVTVGAANAPPVARDDDAWVIWGNPVRIRVLDNDTDADGDQLTITSIGPVANGTAVILDNGIRYISRPDFFGQENFTYTISDGRGGTATATVHVTVVDP